MSYTDYLNRMKINMPKVIDTQMRLPDASSFTWRTKLGATSVNRRTDHVMNNTQDPRSSPSLVDKRAMSYVGTGFGGKVQDASSYTLSLGARSIGNDVFTGGRIQTNTQSTSIDSATGKARCLVSTPASQVVNQNGNADHDTTGLNMAYVLRQPYGPAMCYTRFNPLSESQFVDTLPAIKTKKMGVLPVGSETSGGRDTNAGAQGTIVAINTYTSGNVKDASGNVIPNANQPYNTYSEPPYNPAKALFVTSPTGPQVGGERFPGARASKVGGATPLAKRMITHRGWANPTRTPYPNAFVPPTGAPAQKKINDPNHYKV